MKEKRILSLVTLLAMVLSLMGGLFVSRMEKVKEDYKVDLAIE